MDIRETMFRLIKWLIIISIGCVIWYLITFVSSLNEHEVRIIKSDAIKAIDSSDASIFTESIGGMVKADLSHKQEGFFSTIKKKIRNWIELERQQDDNPIAPAEE
jgi:hypothetical protein